MKDRGCDVGKFSQQMSGVLGLPLPGPVVSGLWVRSKQDPGLCCGGTRSQATSGNLSFKSCLNMLVQYPMVIDVPLPCGGLQSSATISHALPNFWSGKALEHSVLEWSRLDGRGLKNGKFVTYTSAPSCPAVPKFCGKEGGWTHLLLLKKIVAIYIYIRKYLFDFCSHPL